MYTALYHSDKGQIDLIKKFHVPVMTVIDSRFAVRGDEILRVVPAAARQPQTV